MKVVTCLSIIAAVLMSSQAMAIRPKPSAKVPRTIETVTSSVTCSEDDESGKEVWVYLQTRKTINLRDGKLIKNEVLKHILRYNNEDIKNNVIGSTDVILDSDLLTVDFNPVGDYILAVKKNADEGIALRCLGD